MSDKNYKLNNKWDGLAQHIAAVIHDNTDITILTIFSTLNEVSVYAVYCLVVKALKQLVQAFNNGIDASFGDMLAKREKENINNKFNLYEVIYFSIVTIAFSVAIVLIIPFVEIYTAGVTDANYIRPLFGVLIICSEYLWAIRLPYSSTTLAAGHFKQTRIGAWIEAGSNIIISLILVKKYGIVGVAIGTIVAMLIRTVEFLYHTNKYILNRSCKISIKKIIVIVVETPIIVAISKYIPYLENTSYINWIINAIITTIMAGTIVIGINLVLFKNEMLSFLNIIKRIIKKEK